MIRLFTTSKLFSSSDLVKNLGHVKRRGLFKYDLELSNSLKCKEVQWTNFQLRNFKSQQRRNAELTPRVSNTQSGPVPFGNLTKSFGFTLAFSSATFLGATIWQYENMRHHALSMMKKPMGWLQQPIKKAGGWRQQLNEFWTSLNEGQRLFIPICLLNTIVFAVWRIPRFQPFMLKYFVSNPAAKIICWPMVLSTFSHFSAFHLIANMYVLYSFSSGVVASMGKEQFIAMYLTGGVISSFTSYLYKALTSQSGMSLGASGSIMAVLGYVCSEYPSTQLNIIFLPMYTFSAGAAIKCIMALDLTGIILGWKFFDHAAHLGGALFGLFWCYLGNEYIWQKREPILQYWHQLRGNGR